MEMLRFRPNHLRFAILTVFLLVSFQNCGQPGSIQVNPQTDQTQNGGLAQNPQPEPSPGQLDQASQAPPVLAPPSGGPVVVVPPGPVKPPVFIPQVYTTQTYVTTKLNTPIEFTLTELTEPKLTDLRIDISSISSKTGSLSGLLDPRSTFKYTPSFGYRGREVVTIVAKDNLQNVVKFNVNIVVGNPLQLIKPALAIRGMGCIQCHAQVNSNIITDFGYGSPFFFNANQGGNWWKNGGLYGDHSNAFSTMNLPSSVNVIVPAATLPPAIATSTVKTSLASYIQSRFNVAVYSETKNVLVKEKAKVYIGAPNEEDIIRSFSMSPETRQAYFKNSESAIALSGLNDQRTFFKNEGTLNCEGDVALRGPVYLVDLRVNSETGCRIYVIGSVFIFGPISQISSSETRNLQITSTRSINLGLGSMKKNDSFCDPNSRYAKDTQHYGTSSLANRYSTFWTVPSQATRSIGSPYAFGNKILEEASIVEATEGTFLDASCRSEGRNISFDRILLNAPSVQSRYEGDVIGTIIAEYSIMSLGKFKFQYDRVFDKVPILPFFDHKIYLDIED